MRRPLTGEPLAVDLVNTRWISPGGERDLLATGEGLDQWLRERRLAPQSGEPVRAALAHARDVLRRAFEHEPGAEDELNAVLARALIVRSLRGGQVHEQPLFADGSWLVPWLAADDYLRLRQTGPDSVRRCGNPACILYFHDPTGRRRWCSMTACGNRAKAHRHYVNRRQAAVTSRDNT